MAELAIIVASSPLPPPSSSPPRPNPLHKPWPPPPPRSRRRQPLPRPPLLSDVRLDLIAPRRGDRAPTRHLLKHYARLASKLAGGGRLRDFLMIAESVLTSDAVATYSPQFVSRINTRLVARGISRVLAEGNLEEVLDFLSAAEKLGFCPASLFDEPAVEALGTQCRLLVDEGRLEEFVGLMETLAGYQFFLKDVVDPVDILKIFVEKCDPNMAIRYASIFPHSQLLLCSIMHGFGKKQDIASAVIAFEAIKQKSGGFNMFACRSMIDICGLCGDYLRSRGVFEDMLAEKITPNTYVFNSLMNVNAHDLGYTFHIFKHMQALGVTADMASYNILLKACCSAKRVDLAQEIYQEIKHMGSKGTLKLDVITYSTMIKLFADAKMWHMALDIKEDMLLADVRPNVITWSSLISACANVGLVDRAVQMFEEMLLFGCEPNAQCCNILLAACVESCQYDRAFRFFYIWKERGFKISSTAKGRECSDKHVSLTAEHPTEIGSSQSISCTYDPQPSGVNRVVPFRPTVATYNILIKACGTDHYRAKALMDEMKVIGLSPNHISWSILIDIYGTSQNVRGAMEALRTMREAGINLDVIAYTTAIKACVENKNLKIAFSLFEEMKRYQLQPNRVTYNTLLRARSRYGSLHEVKQCLSIYKDMRKAGYNSNDYYLKELIEEWCEGVICGTNQSRGLDSAGYPCKADIDRPHNLLLEKVATHLQKDVGQIHTVDIRGLTKVEARIVVLSVLRMIKESYQLGKAIKDDMIIISGGRSSCNSEVQNAIVQVLQDELGLDVVSGHGAMPDGNEVPNPLRVGKHSAALQKTLHPEVDVYVVRRPEDLGVMKVTQKSLHEWLQKKSQC